MKNKTYETILLAAGEGTRLGASYNKVLLSLSDGRPLFDYALRTFLEDIMCSHIILVIRKSDEEIIQQNLEEIYKEIPSKITFVYGGTERQYSVENGLDALKVKNPDEGYVMVHDAARPFVEKKLLQELFLTVQKENAAILAIPAKDTIKKVQDGVVSKTLYRPEIWQVQTPQAFLSSLLVKAYKQAKRENYIGNEEGELVERLGHLVKIVQGNAYNFKVTTPEDLELAKGLANLRK